MMANPIISWNSKPCRKLLSLSFLVGNRRLECKWAIPCFLLIPSSFKKPVDLLVPWCLPQSPASVCHTTHRSSMLRVISDYFSYFNCSDIILFVVFPISTDFTALVEKIVFKPFPYIKLLICTPVDAGHIHYDLR